MWPHHLNVWPLSSGRLPSVSSPSFSHFSRLDVSRSKSHRQHGIQKTGSQLSKQLNSGHTMWTLTGLRPYLSESDNTAVAPNIRRSVLRELLAVPAVSIDRHRVDRAVPRATRLCEDRRDVCREGLLQRGEGHDLVVALWCSASAARFTRHTCTYARGASITLTRSDSMRSVTLCDWSLTGPYSGVGPHERQACLATSAAVRIQKQA
jgi:hypothetical protein